MKLVKSGPKSLVGETITIGLRRDHHDFLVEEGMPPIRRGDRLSSIRAGQWMMKNLPLLADKYLKPKKKGKKPKCES